MTIPHNDVLVGVGFFCLQILTLRSMGIACHAAARASSPCHALRVTALRNDGSREGGVGEVKAK